MIGGTAGDGATALVAGGAIESTSDFMCICTSLRYKSFTSLLLFFAGDEKKITENV